MVTIIIPTYNRHDFLKRSVNSVLTQSDGEFTLIIVDDGSTDETETYLKNLSDTRIKVIRQENRGVSVARNTGIHNAETEWIAFLDSDDEWMPYKLEKQKRFLTNHPHLSFLHSNEIWVRQGIRVNAPKRFDKSNDRIFERSLEMCLISPSTVMLRKSLLKKWNYFNEDFKVCEDYDLWLKILATEEVGFIEEPLIYKYGGHEQLSTQHHSMDYWRLKSLLELIHLPEITPQQRVLITQEIDKKYPILIKGYEKYGNKERISEIQALMNTFKRSQGH